MVCRGVDFGPDLTGMCHLGLVGESVNGSAFRQPAVISFASCILAPISMSSDLPAKKDPSIASIFDGQRRQVSLLLDLEKLYSLLRSG